MLSSLAILNLKLLVCICFQVFLSHTFHDRKDAKGPGTGLVSRMKLWVDNTALSHPARHSPLCYSRLTAGGIVDLLNKFTSCKQHPSVGCYLPQTSFVHSSGTKQLAIHALATTPISTAQTYFVLFPMNEWLFAVILTVPVFF